MYQNQTTFKDFWLVLSSIQVFSPPLFSIKIKMHDFKGAHSFACVFGKNDITVSTVAWNYIKKSVAQSQAVITFKIT